MKRTSGIAWALALTGLMAGAAVVQADDPVIASVTVTPDSAEAVVGDELEFEVAVLDSSGSAVDADVVWAVSDSLAGEVNEDGEFKAIKAGTVLVIATAGALSDTAVVTIAEDEDPPAGNLVASIEIVPGSAITVIDESFQFGLEAKNAEGGDVEAEVTWSVSDESIGTVDQTGNFTGKAEGEVYVIAVCGALLDSAFVTVSEEPLIDPDTPTVTIYRINPSGKLAQCGEAVTEGGVITIGGMPHPLNVLNGMTLSFPEGSLPETIQIVYSTPKFAKVGQNDVTFEDGIVNGVTFEVAVDGEAVSPYYFGVPIDVAIPYKRGLLANLGLKPEDLGMFFAADSGELESDPGITDIVVDLERNVITGKVAHFSTIVLAPKSAAPTAVKEQAPAAFALSQNVPNPFNPATIISFAVPASGMVKLGIYNVLGQEVRTLVNGQLAAGSHSVVWNGRDEMGRAATSGVYFYRLDAGSLTATKKLMLLR
jgi:hypothetical protein